MFKSNEIDLAAIPGMSMTFRKLADELDTIIGNGDLTPHLMAVSVTDVLNQTFH